MSKRHLHHLWTKLRPISSWYFLVGFIIFGGLFVYTNRQNNIRMIELRNAVFAVDEQGGDIEKALRELRTYIYGHMNTDLTSTSTAIRPPIQLKHQYDRLVAAESERVAEVNSRVRQEAETICFQRFPVTLNATGREPCIQGYINENGVEEQPIPKELYQFDFISPHWTPDVAGWSLVLATVFGGLFITRFTLERWMRGQLKEHP